MLRQVGVGNPRHGMARAGPVHQRLAIWHDHGRAQRVHPPGESPALKAVPFALSEWRKRELCRKADGTDPGWRYRLGVNGNVAPNPAPIHALE